VAIASFKDLCLDAGDALVLGRFWHRVLGGTIVEYADETAAEIGTTDGTKLYVDPVPEPRTGGTRVHLDLRLPAADPAPLVEAGATLLREPGGDIRWWVLADPEGNQFCAFPPRPDTPEPPGNALAHVYELVIGVTDAPAQARWWATVLGGETDIDEAGGAALINAAGLRWECVAFDVLPWPKTVKNRMHWDVALTDPAPDALVAAGATLLREPGWAASDRSEAEAAVKRPPGNTDIHWWVLADPEGNEFCAFAPK
jgi:hypothetical protein